MDTTPARRTLLFVHAHPDDETLATGVTLAQRVLDGDAVHVLTCTLGEEGEIIPPGLAHLAGDRVAGLGAHRRGELAAAMAELGVAVTVLGEDETGRTAYRDSGMAGTESTTAVGAFARADLAEAAGAIAAHLRRVRPDVVVTYDARGGYEHPDHVQAHRATCAAVATLPPAERPALWAVVVPRSTAAADRAWVLDCAPRDQGLAFLNLDEAYPPGVVDDRAVTWRVQGSEEALSRRDAALRAHATQVRVGDGWYALSNAVAARLPKSEAYVELDPESGAFRPAGAPVDARRAP